MEQDKLNTGIIQFLSGRIDRDKLLELNKDLKNNSVMQQQIDDYSKLWDKSTELKQFDEIDVDGDWKSVRKRMGFAQKSKKIPLRSYLLRISAILIFAFGLAYFLNVILKQVPGNNRTDYYQVTAMEQMKDVNLPDGSIVTLNANASLFYNNAFGTENRDLILEGEAFFDVKRNESIPFRVFVANSTVEVLGTSFNIKNQKNEVQLSVVSGHVAFFETSNKNNRVELVKNEMIQYHTKKQVFESKSMFNPNVIAWKSKKLKFDDAPMEEVFGSVAGYFNLELVIETNDSFTESFTATFNDQPLEEIIEIIKIGTQQDFSVDVKENKLIIRN